MQRAMTESLRAMGVTTLPCDKATKARLKVLAGDTPLCVKVKELVELGELVERAERGESGGGGSQVPLPGHERLVSSNTLSAVNVKLNKVIELLSQTHELDEAFVKAMGITGKWSPDSPHLVVAEAISKLVTELKERSSANSSQLRLEA
jgi:hypothetical protein